MSKFFTGERFGTPQFIAAFLLLIFLAQCAWFIAHAPLNQVEGLYIQSGISMLRGGDSAGDQYRSPVVALISAVPVYAVMKLRGTSDVDQFSLDQNRWPIRAPFVLMGLLLGASLWYVARRLYGNAGGYIALVLYVFTPGIVARSSLVGPQIPAAWGAFGIIFTAIAVAHTLYAPREVILWNWRRICLLAVAIALAVGSQFTLWLLLLLALAYMFWAVPHRRLAALVILFAATGIALALLWSFYLFRGTSFVAGIRHAQWLNLQPQMLAANAHFVFRVTATFFLRDLPAGTLMFLIALGTYVAWRRARFFGNTAPLLTFSVLLLASLISPQGVGLTLLFVSLPFMMVFVAGIFADLLENPRTIAFLGVIIGILLSHALLSIWGLFLLSHGMRR
jgi:Dolichyl-phosphate-mannose-protein mannosyltransferase